ncbi:winged helix-turn-helix domain-containing protein [Amycolatopsis thermoflava]|uniref:winged helix-turn-helix domain-containing protein n=1 Tax=Amycolatopsis thermoflava TaxID=84480 RepID=UPI00365088B1
MSQRERIPEFAYMLVAEAIKSRIESGEWRPHRPLPAERRLAQELGYALGTVRHGTRILRDLGLLYTVPAKGTFVAPEAPALLRRGVAANLLGGSYGAGIPPQTVGSE